MRASDSCSTSAGALDIRIASDIEVLPELMSHIGHGLTSLALIQTTSCRVVV